MSQKIQVFLFCSALVLISFTCYDAWISIMHGVPPLHWASKADEIFDVLGASLTGGLAGTWVYFNNN